jgi:hypothetical protein
MADATDITVEPRLSAKDEMRALLDRLPDDATLKDIQYHLDVVIKIKVLEAEAQLERGEGITQDEFDRRFARWLAK